MIAFIGVRISWLMLARKIDLALLAASSAWAQSRLWRLACSNWAVVSRRVRDAFRRTAQKAAGWIEEIKGADKDDEENRQIILQELNFYMDINLSEKFSDSIPLSDKVKMRFPSTIDRIRDNVIEQIKAYVRCCAAIRLIEHEHFDNENILVERNRETYANLIFGIDANVQSYNSYFDIRQSLFHAEWDEDEEESGISSAIPGEREGLLTIKLDQVNQAARPGGKNLAKVWMADAKNRAVMSVRSLIVGDRTAFKEYAIARKWIKP